MESIDKLKTHRLHNLKNVSYKCKKSVLTLSDELKHTAQRLDRTAMKKKAGFSHIMLSIKRFKTGPQSLPPQLLSHLVVQLNILLPEASHGVLTLTMMMMMMGVTPSDFLQPKNKKIT